MLQNNPQFVFRIISGMILMNLLVFGLSGYSLYTSRVRYDEQARIETGNLARALEYNISGILDKIDLAILEVKAEAELQLANGGIDIASFDNHISGTLARVPEMGEMLMATANGDAFAYGLKPGVRNTANIADRDYFIAQRDNPAAGLFISKPLLGRISKKWHVNLARRVNNPDGSFAGVIHGNLQISQLLKLFASYDLGKNCNISLRRTDLSIVARHPETENSTPGNLSISNEYSRVIKEGKASGNFEATSGVDGIHRVFSFRKIDKFQMYINCGFATQDYLSAWYMELYKQLALLLMFVLVTLASMRYILMSWKEKQSAYNELSTARDNLEHRVAERTDELQTVNDNLLIQSSQLLEEISSRKQAEALLKTSEENWRSFAGLTSDYVHKCTRKGIAPFRIKWMGGAYGTISGYSSEEIYTLGCWLPLVHPDDRDSVASYLFSLVPGDLKQVEFRMLTKESSIRWISETSRCEVSSTEGELILYGAATDITERKRSEEERDKLEKQLLHAQKLESLGVLAGGIAHDFNNILTSIVGNADLALMRINKESPVVNNLHAIEQASARAADLAKQMLAYSGKGKFIIENLDLGILVEEMLHMLEVSISKKAVLRLNLTPNLPSVEADATQIRQIIMNLVINASEAIGDNNGLITVSTGCMECNKSYLKDFCSGGDISEGLYVYLEISDSGCGMDKETLGKIFDPFFTTKFTGRGLGMAAVHGIVRGHKGSINVYSEPGKGTSFKILLPASEKPVEIVNSNNHKDDWRGEGKVLLVDDEEIVLSIGIEMLQELGFSTITANDGMAALEAFKATPDISFVILDLTMPHLDGEQCFQELLKIKPDVKVFISSGFSEHEITQKFVGKGLAGFIQKPYKLSVLREAIQKI